MATADDDSFLFGDSSKSTLFDDDDTSTLSSPVKETPIEEDRAPKNVLFDDDDDDLFAF